MGLLPHVYTVKSAPNKNTTKLWALRYSGILGHIVQTSSKQITLHYMLKLFKGKVYGNCHT